MRSMNNTMKADVEVFVHKKQDVSFSCPSCMLQKTINTENILHVPHWMVNATCTRCGHKFTISFNFRKYFRKETALRGLVYASGDATDALAEVLVTDLSMTGLGFQGEGPWLEPGAVLTIRFLLDDDDQTVMDKEVKVESIRDDKVGASFVDPGGFDRVLGKFILSK